MLQSRPMRARELKREGVVDETKVLESRPMRARELKREIVKFGAMLLASRPMRARELKRLAVASDRRAEGRRAPCGRVN